MNSCRICRTIALSCQSAVDGCQWHPARRSRFDAGPACSLIGRMVMLACLLLIDPAGPNRIAAGESEPSDVDSAFELSEPRTYRLKLTFRVESKGAALRNVTVTGPVPIDWREQRVKLIEERKPAGVTMRVTQFLGQAAMLVIRIPAVSAGGSATAERVYEVTRYQVRFRGDPKSLRVPEKPSRELRKFLGSAPGVEVTDGKVRRLAKSLIKQETDAWSNVAAIHKWVRSNVKYRAMAFRGAEFAMKKKVGDCEDMTALFVALCRSSGIPARTVWIEGHAYPEFYLEDGAGKGFWIPAQVSGPAWFGRMAEYRPILQKTDRVRDPIRGRYVRYVPQTARASGGAPRLSISRIMSINEKTKTEPRR